MKLYRFITIIVLIASAIIFTGCPENPIPYELTDPELSVDTLTIRTIDGGTYLSPPLMGSTNGLYFGNTDEFNNLYSLIKLSNKSLNGQLYNYSLRDTSVKLDSLVFTFTALNDTLLTDSRFELFYFPQSGDSVFSESESNYINITEADVANAVAIGQSVFSQKEPDSTESIYPELTFNIEQKDDILQFISDTSSTKNRTFMLRNIDPIDNIVSIRAREASNYGKLTVHYKVNEDTLKNIFYPIQDITVVEPRSITKIDKDHISISRAAGLKSILKFDFGNFPITDNIMVIKSATLIINSLQDAALKDFEVKAVVLEESLNISEYWEIAKDEYDIENDLILTGTFNNNQMKMEIRQFLQGINTGSFNNYGLKLYGGTASDPYTTANLILDRNNPDNLPYLKITYVKL